MSPFQPRMNRGATAFTIASLDTTGQQVVAADSGRVGIAFIKNHGATNAALAGPDTTNAVVRIDPTTAGGVNWIPYLGTGPIFLKAAASTTTVSGWYL
jgi:hypothetical protein